MSQEINIKLFETKKVRTVWDEVQVEWFFSVLDLLQVFVEKQCNPLGLRLSVEMIQPHTKKQSVRIASLGRKMHTPQHQQSVRIASTL